jgi:DNA-binding HxlR family transcriptional regulator
MLANDFTMQNEMRRAFAMLSGKWKLEIMWLLHQRVHRFGELRKAIPGITQHMLTAQLRELEADGLVTRTVFAEVEGIAWKVRQTTLSENISRTV